MSVNPFLHDFVLYIEMRVAYIRPTGGDTIFIYGYERSADWLNKAIRLISFPLEGVVRPTRPVFGVGLLHYPSSSASRDLPRGNTLIGGLQVLNLSNVRLQVHNAMVPGRTQQPLGYNYHIQGLRQHGAMLPTDLTLSGRVISRHGWPVNSFNDYCACATAELILLCPPTVTIPGTFFTGELPPPPIEFQLTARVGVEAELHSEPRTLDWCIYHFQSATDFTNPAVTIIGSGVARFSHPNGWYELLVSVFHS
jgi:hypothetical protein